MTVTDAATGDAATKHQVVVQRRGGGLHYIPFIISSISRCTMCCCSPTARRAGTLTSGMPCCQWRDSTMGKPLAAAEAEAAEAEAAEGDGQADTGPRRLTRLQYGAYRLMVRHGELNPILLSRRLGQEGIMGTYAAYESATSTGSASTRSSSALRPFRCGMLCSQGGALLWCDVGQHSLFEHAMLQLPVPAILQQAMLL